MKKYFVFFFVFLTIQLNNVTYGQDDRWVYITESDNNEFYLDKETVNYYSYFNTISCWVKIICIKDCRIQNKKIDFIICKYTFKNDEINVQRRIVYYSDGTTYSYEEKGGYKPIVPDSVSETLNSYLLNNYSFKRKFE